MQINRIRISEPSFMSEEKRVFGFDDSVSKARRDILRANILSDSMPYYGILENNGKLEEYELKKLISSLCGQKVNQNSLQSIFQQVKHKPQTLNETISPKSQTALNHELICSLSLFNMSLVSEKLGVYRGESPQAKLNNLKTLKQAGIERIVDLAGYDDMEEACKSVGLEYFAYLITPYSFTNNPMFKTEEETRAKFFNQCRLFGYKEDESKIYQERMLELWRKNKNTEIDEFVKFVQTMQKGNVYIGCEYGTYTTDNALMLNSFFNPLYLRTPKYVNHYNRVYTRNFEKLYQNLTDEHKALMRWTKEFDKMTGERLKILAKVF